LGAVKKTVDTRLWCSGWRYAALVDVDAVRSLAVITGVCSGFVSIMSPVCLCTVCQCAAGASGIWWPASDTADLDPVSTSRRRVTPCFSTTLVGGQVC